MLLLHSSALYSLLVVTYCYTRIDRVQSSYTEYYSNSLLEYNNCLKLLYDTYSFALSFYNYALFPLVIYIFQIPLTFNNDDANKSLPLSSSLPSFSP